MLLAESVRAVPKYQSNKTPLQRAVQILKRHRDIMFAGDEDKPVSIIITTLAAKAYQGEGSITEALQTILIHMDKYILNEFDPQSGKTIKKVENPVIQRKTLLTNGSNTLSVKITSISGWKRSEKICR